MKTPNSDSLDTNTVTPVEDFTRTLGADDFRQKLERLDPASRIMCIHRARKAICTASLILLHGPDRINAALKELEVWH